MYVDEATRRRIRTTQDEIIRIATTCGYQESARVSFDLPETVTIAALRDVIYPEYEHILTSVWAQLRREESGG